MVRLDRGGGHCLCNWPSNWSVTCTGCRGNWLVIIVILSACVRCWATETMPTDCTDTLQLLRGTNHSGHVQVLLDGAWHDVCSQGWDEGIGAVLCTHLGFPSFVGFGNGSREMVELEGEMYQTYARCKGTEACLSACEGHAWQRVAVNAPTPMGITPCYLTAGPVLQCSHTELIVSADPVNTTAMAARSDGFNMVADIQEARQHEDCPNSSETRTGSDSVGQITSPFYPQFYPGQTHCRWKIEVHHSQQVELVVIDFETEKDRDFLSIYEGRISSSGFSRVARLHGNLTGNGSKLTFQSCSSVVYLDFHSDEYINARGFLIQFNAFPPLSDADKKTITEKRRSGLTAYDTILLSVGMLLLLLMSLCTLLAWRRKTKSNKIGFNRKVSLHEDFPVELEARNTKHCRSTRSHHEPTNTLACRPEIATVMSQAGATSCETQVDILDCNRLSKGKKDREKGKIKTDGLILDCSAVSTLSPVEC